MTSIAKRMRILDPAPVRRLDVLGGKRLVSAIILAALIIIIVDNWLLTPIYGIDGYRFTNYAGDTIQSGGFSWVFIIIFFIFSLASHFLFRQSLWLGWIFLVVCLGLQALIGTQQDIVRFFEYLQSAGSNDVFSDSLIAAIVFSWEEISNLVEYRYDPGLGGVRLGISAGFAQSIVLNTMLLIGAIGLAVALAACGWLIRQAGRIFGKAADDTNTDPFRIKGYYPLLGAERTIAFYAGAIALLFAASAPMAALLIEGSKQNLEELQNILWIGPLVVMLEMARLALYPVSPKSAPAPEAKSMAAEKMRWVPRVHEHLQTVLRRRNAAMVIPAAGTLESARTAIRGAEDTFQAGELRYFLETLTLLHLTRLSALLASTALDWGRSALIICPAEVKLEVLDRFQTARGAGESGFGEEWVDIAQKNPDQDITIDVIVISPEEIETLLQRSKEFAADLRRLGAIFVLNLERTDLGLLSLNLRRLRNASRHSGDLVYIAQSEPLIDQENRIQQSLPRTSAARGRGDLDIAGKSNRYISVWPAIPGDSIANPANWPVEVHAILAAHEINEALKPYLWDVRGSFQTSHWEITLPPLLVERNKDKLAAIVRNLRPEKLGPPPGQHPFAVIAADGNLADALALGIGNGDSEDAGCVIAMTDYPLARLHFTAFRNQVANAHHAEAANREALRTFRDAYGSISPKPKVGPVELALMLANEFVVSSVSSRTGPDGGWLAQSAIEEYWQGESAEALRQLQVNTTKTGLVRLFRLCIGQNIQIEQERHANLIRRYKLQNPRQTEGATISHLVVRTNSFALTRIPAADHGLSYADGTHLIINNAMYQVTGINEDNRTLWVQEADGNEPRYAFVRSYAIVRASRRNEPGQADDQHDIAVDAYFQEPNARIPFELASGYIRVARRTSLAYRYASPNAAFLGSENGPIASACNAPQPARLRSATLLRLYGDTTAGRRSRRGGDRGASRHEACVAFTLATTLQDTLASLFPRHAHRIAVVAPQAARIEAEIDPGRRGLPHWTVFALARQPVLTELDSSRQAVDPESSRERCRLSNDAIRTYEAYIGRFFEQARAVDDARAAPPGVTRLFSFLIVEDSDHDLGVARIVAEQRDRVFRIWEEFLNHCAKNTSDPHENYYAFNSGKISEIFKFEDALTVVGNMRRH